MRHDDYRVEIGAIKDFSPGLVVIDDNWKDCPVCDGMGEDLDGYVCPECDGIGEINEEAE